MACSTADFHSSIMLSPQKPQPEKLKSGSALSQPLSGRSTACGNSLLASMRPAAGAEQACADKGRRGAALAGLQSG
jgi:hypothetical protein